MVTRLHYDPEVDVPALRWHHMGLALLPVPIHRLAVAGLHRLGVDCKCPELRVRALEVWQLIRDPDRLERLIVALYEKIVYARQGQWRAEATLAERCADWPRPPDVSLEDLKELAT